MTKERDSSELKYWNSVPRGWSTQPLEGENSDVKYEDLWYQGGDVIPATEIEHGGRIEERNVSRRRRSHPT